MRRLQKTPCDPSGFCNQNHESFFSFLLKYNVQQSPDLVTVNIVNIPGLVKELLLTILLLLLSKITVDLVKNLDLVKFFLLTKNFTKSGLYCTTILICSSNHFMNGKNCLKITSKSLIFTCQLFTFKLVNSAVCLHL